MKQSRKSILNLQNGQSLVEVVIALGIVVVLAVSLVSASLVTQRSSRAAKNNTQATKLVQQSVENLRVFRDRKGFSALINGNCWKLVATDVNPFNWNLTNSNACPEKITLDQLDFFRKIIIENPPSPLDSAKAKKITVEVTWTDSGGLQKISNVTNLSNCITGSVIC